MRQLWFVYLLRRTDGALYCGVTVNVLRRIKQHEAGKGAKCLRGRGPLQLEYLESVVGRGAAQRREAAIKRLSKADKEQMIHV